MVAVAARPSRCAGVPRTAGVIRYSDAAGVDTNADSPLDRKQTKRGGALLSSRRRTLTKLSGLLSSEELVLLGLA